MSKKTLKREAIAEQLVVSQNSMTWVLGITIAACALLLVEAALLRRAARGIPCRVVVTGTRGKSSLVKTLLAGIREVESATWGKITGDIPSILLPDGTTRVLVRRGPAHLREQARFLRSCSKHRARCIVVEAMSISPEAMVAEMRLLRPTLVIVANVRDDHQETLGAGLAEQRAAYLASLPRGCRWMTRDTGLLAFAARSARYPTPEPFPLADPGSVVDGHVDIASETLSTAEAALDCLGWNTEPARNAVRAAALRVVAPPRSVVFAGREVTLLDAFSANDPQSLDRLWSAWRRDTGDASKWSVLLNTRCDRPLRTRQFCRWIAGRRDIDEVFVAGSHGATAARLLRRQNVRFSRLPAGKPASNNAAGKVFVGIGNAQGMGLILRAAAAEGVR